MAINEKPFVGEFNELLEDFIQYKRNLGYKYDVIRSNLQRFSRFTLNYTIINQSLTKELVLDWAKKEDGESVKTREHRVNNLRQFALYLQHMGYDAFIPHKLYKLKRQEYIPYIFTQQEISHFFQAVDVITPHRLSNKHLSYPLLFRILYCCGLRISELIHLKIADIDIDSGTLFIRNSKFNKDRLIPMSDVLAAMCRQYHVLFNINILPDDYFFRNKSDVPIAANTVYKAFRKLLWQAGISHQGKGIGPRLHDVRHTFCVHTLAKQVNDGVDLYVSLPILSTYIGHSSIQATQRYVRLTEEVYPELIEKISKKCAYVIPGISDYETH